MIVLDHTTPDWIARQARTNGAETYSADLVKYQIPHWRKSLPENSIISTCPVFQETRVFGGFDVAVQYLHFFPVKNPVEYVKRIAKNLPFQTKRLIFITAYKRYEYELRRAGYEARFVPMAIDVDTVQRRDLGVERDPEKIIWFGNVKSNKRSTFQAVKLQAAKAGFDFVHISGSKFYSKMLTQVEAWKIIARYKYAVAVGRCALEAYALGLKVLIAGRGVGGLVIDNEDLALQTNTNFNARYSTYSNELDKCLHTLPQSQIVKPLDIRQLVHPKLCSLN